ncbi:MAG TPA: hypothetical protein VKE42_12780 [Candidatus Cybelea sp.]|nr:hypothetical protein [Candidatus Cybelea sp.]
MHRLERFFETLRGKDGVSRLRLRVPTDGRARGLSIDREVCVEARRTRGEASLNDLMLITWVPEGTGVFPAFEGILIVRSENGTSSIELDGTYTPPFGAAGQVFDATIGHRIAESTAHELLKDLKAAVER